jgi:NAD(P)-dependent dehydrogenase (short-subunit alcohol dehydrogenase family)
MVERGRGVIGDVTSAAGCLKPHAAIGDGGWALTYGVSKAGMHRIVAQLLVEHAADGIVAFNLQPGAVATERVLAAGEKLDFVARHAAPVEHIGTTIARILDEPGAFENGKNIQVQDVAKEWGIL